MRRFVLIAALMAAVAAPAAAQDLRALQRDNEIRMEQDAARQQAVALSNQLTAIESRLGTEQALRQVEAQRTPLRLPAPVQAAPGAPPPSSGPIAGIPDDRLAASNAAIAAAVRDGR